MKTKAAYWAKHPSFRMRRAMAKAQNRKKTFELQAARMRARLTPLLIEKARATSGGLTTYTYAAPVRAVATQGAGAIPCPDTGNHTRVQSIGCGPKELMEGNSRRSSESCQGNTTKPVGNSILV
jgi:hypothetical protein